MRKPTTPRNRWWLAAIPGVALLIAFQIWSAIDVKVRTERLQALLEESYETSLGLTRAVGYGGLIHNFKNHLLRPDNPSYLDQARQDTQNAIARAEALERIAAELGIKTRLEQTRTMIATYAERLETIRTHSQAGLNPAEVDAKLRFNDSPALQEIDQLVKEMTRAVNQQINSIGTQGSTLYWISSVVTILLSTLLLTLISQRAKRIQDLKSIESLNEKLTDSNTSLTTANQSLQHFAGLVSHDLKTPLRHVSFYASMIEEDIEKPSEIQVHLDGIQKSVVRLTRLIGSLLDFTKTGFTKPEIKPVSLHTAAQLAVADLAPLVREKSARIKVDMPDTVSADPVLLGRVLQNLVGNSLKYTCDGVWPEITLKSWEEDGLVKFSISDNGIGIEPEFAERVFEPFERLHATGSAYEGCGIGLSLVRTVIQAHDGEVSVDTSYTQGTRIVVTLSKATQAA